MNNSGIQYRFKATVWKHASASGWYFVSLPQSLSLEIRNALKSEEEGWGRLKATAKIGNSEWKTAIWYDTKRAAYLLPLKAVIRKQENTGTGETVQVSLWI